MRLRPNSVKITSGAIFLLMINLIQSAGAGEADLILPDLSTVSFFNINGHSLLLYGMSICIFGFIFGLIQFLDIKRMNVHSSMKEVSEHIYETCKTYLFEQGKFILMLEIIIGIVLFLYFKLLKNLSITSVSIILLSSLIGIMGSYFIAWFGMRINTMANSATAFKSLEGKPYPVSSIPLKAGMSIGMLLVSVELFLMLCILLFVKAE